MWNPPPALTLEAQKIAARTRKTRKFFVFLRAHRHELLDADLQNTLAQSYSADPTGKAPVEVGLLALALLWQAYGNVRDRDAVALTVRAKRWQMGLDCGGAEQLPFSQGTLFTLRMRLMAHNLAKTLLDRTVALAEKAGGFGARQLRAALDSPPWLGAGRGEDTLNLLGHALRKAVGLVAQELGTSTDLLLEEAGLTLVGHSSRKAALALHWGEPGAQAKARRLVLEEVERGKRWLEQYQSLAAPAAPLQDGMDTIVQIVEPDTAPAPEGGPGGRRLKKQVAPDRRSSIEDKAMRPGRQSSAKTVHGFKEHFGLALDSQVPREVVVCPANEPEDEAVALVAEALERGQGLRQLAIDLGDRASPRLAQWAAQGVYIMARPWPQGGLLCTKPDFTLDFQRGPVTGPNGQTVPIIPGKDAPCPASACDPCPVRVQCPTARIGQGRSLTIREDEQGQQKLRAKLQSKRGRASLRKRTAVEHAMAHPLAHQGRRARDKGLRKNQFDGRRHAAVSHLQGAAHYEEQHRLAS
jgi:hypothetical protein